MATQLPRRIVKAASAAFARDTGMSGPQICDFFADWTDELGGYVWMGGGAPSRWMLFEEGLGYLSAQDQAKAILQLCRAEPEDISMSHGRPSRQAVDRLVAMLAEDVGPGVSRPDAFLGDRTDWHAVKASWEEALQLVDADPEGAIREARTTLESVCKHILDERSVGYEQGADLAKLYRTTAKSLNLAPDQYTEQVFRQILSGVGSVVEGLGAVRNAHSDAHGAGKGRVRPKARHARLAVNLACGVAGFLIETHTDVPVTTSSAAAPS